MIWLLILASPVVALLGWLASRRYRPLGGSILVVGRIPQELDPRPGQLEVEVADGRRVRVHLGEAPLEARWPRRPLLRPGSRVAIEALSVEQPREEAGYRENAQGSRLEAARVWLGSPPSRSRWPIALALLPLLGAAILRSREAPVSLACPSGASLGTVPRAGGGWLGTCTRQGTAHGPYLELDARGTRLVEGAHCDGERCGHWAWRDVTGARVQEGDFVAGKRSGRWRFYRAGKTQSEGRFEADLQVGIWRFVHPSGHEWRERFEDGWPVEDGVIRCQ
jgi:hypothetical protein